MVDLPYDYSLDDITSLVSYLAPCTKMMGLDYKKKEEVSKNKYKFSGYLGRNVKND